MQRRGLLILVLCLLLGIAACGGGSSTPALDNGSPDLDGKTGSLNLETWALRSHGSLAPATEQGLPAFPVENPNLERSASGDSDQTVLGDEFLLESGSYIVGDGSVILNGAFTFREDDFPGWALYKIGGLADLKPESLNVECVPQDLGMDYWVGVADFTTLRWKWFGPVGIPEYQLDLSEETSRFVSGLGNLYFVLVCHGDNQARHYQSTVIASGGTSRPGAPTDLYASKGEFPDGVALMWNPGAGADYYEVERREQQVWIQDDGTVNHGGDPIDPEDEIAWEKIGETPDTLFFDWNIQLDVIYEYRVRSINGSGASVYSNVDWGFAYGNGNGGNYSLQGYCYSWEGDGGPFGGGDDGDPNNDGGGDEPPGGGGGGIYPLAGVVLSIMNADGSFMATTQSDERGFYFVENLPAGSYTVVPALEGYSFDPVSAFFEISDWSPAVWIDFIGSTGGGGDPGGEGVHGFVYSTEADPNGTLLPLADATVTVREINTDNIIATFTTREDGSYEFLELPDGAYSISAEKFNYDFGGQVYYFDVIGETPDLRFDFYGVPVP